MGQKQRNTLDILNLSCVATRRSAWGDMHERQSHTSYI